MAVSSMESITYQRHSLLRVLSPDSEDAIPHADPEKEIDTRIFRA